MQAVRFTKFWSALSIEAMGERAAALGYDGLDLAVRDGHPINLDNVSTVLPRATTQWRSLGVDCPMISADVSLIDAASTGARTLFAAAANAGVPRIKIGYFVHNLQDPFQKTWDDARRALQGFATLARDTQVQALVHTHGGLCLGSTCAATRQLIDGFDNDCIAAYPDLGHLAIGGEDIRVGFAMLRGRIAAVAAKDALYVRDPNANTQASYIPAYVPLGDGAAQLQDAISELRNSDFDGPISVHTEYTSDPNVVATVGGADESAAAARLRASGEVNDLQRIRDLWGD
jgi:sugar phosphate isomerase/epimerase